MDMRVSTLLREREKAVIRLLPRQNPFLKLKTWDFQRETLPIYKTWLQQPQGMIILLTGSGKTSTLYTSLQAVARNTSMW